MAIEKFVAYLSLEKHYSPHTLAAYVKDIESFRAFCSQAYEITDIDHLDYGLVRSWVVALVNSKISNRSVNRKVASLKSYYKFLQRVGEISTNPLAKHRALKTAKKVEVPFSVPEMEQVLDELPFDDDFEGVRDRLIIALLYTTGMRRAELINLTLSNVDLESSSLKVLGKRNKERIIPLLPSTQGIFRSYLRERDTLGEDSAANPYVFLSKGGNKIYETLVYRIVNGYFSKVSSKVKKSPHILRHTFATHLLNEGADLNSVKELLGHSSLASTQVYTHNSIAELKKAHSLAHPRNKE